MAYVHRDYYTSFSPGGNFFLESWELDSLLRVGQRLSIAQKTNLIVLDAKEREAFQAIILKLKAEQSFWPDDSRLEEYIRILEAFLGEGINAGVNPPCPENLLNCLKILKESYSHTVIGAPDDDDD